LSSTDTVVIVNFAVFVGEVRPQILSAQYILLSVHTVISN